MIGCKHDWSANERVSWSGNISAQYCKNCDAFVEFKTGAPSFIRHPDSNTKEPLFGSNQLEFDFE